MWLITRRSPITLPTPGPPPLLGLHRHVYLGLQHYVLCPKRANYNESSQDSGLFPLTNKTKALIFPVFSSVFVPTRK
jgi:hypothetical protein